MTLDEIMLRFQLKHYFQAWSENKNWFHSLIDQGKLILPDQGFLINAFQRIILIPTGSTVYTSAGHNPPYILKNDGEIEMVKDRHGLVLGAKKGEEYGESELELKPGEIFFLYTDGVTEAFNDAKELYTLERLEMLLAAYDIESDVNLVSTVINDVNEFEGDSEQTDDITALAIRRLLVKK